MTVIERSAFVPVSPQQMFDLVNDIAKYSEFLPWCAKSVVHTQTPAQIEATLYIAKGPFEKSFTTVNHLTPHQGIEMRLKEGPFRHLTGAWQFQEMANGSQVSLKLVFEMNNPLLAMTFGAAFEHIAGTFVQSFSERAHQIYVSA